MSNMPTMNDILEFIGDRKVIQLGGFQNDILIKRPAPISDAQPSDISFCGVTAKNPLDLLAQTEASLLIVDKNIPIDKTTLSHSNVQAIILSDNARLDFIRVVEKFFTPKTPAGINPSSVIAPSAVIGPDVFIGPLCTIGAGVEIGAQTVIHAGVHIYDHVKIGRNVIINAGTVIGADGFGYERNEEGKLEKFPHVGGVTIEDDVEIGNNVSIDKAVLSITVIKKGCKINNFVHIAHNVQIGENSIIMASVYLGGSVKIGDQCWISPHSILRDRIQIGSNVFIGMGSVVTKNIPDNITVMGSPAREVSEQKKLLKHWAEVINQPEDSEKDAR